MRNTQHVTRSRDGTAPGWQARRVALHLVLVLLAGTSCKASDMVQPHTDIALDRTGPAAERLIRSQHVKAKSLSDGHSIRGSNATLKRRGAGLTVRVKTRELEPGESVDLFWAIFNHPAACTHPHPLTGALCSPPDLFVEETRASLHYVASLTADGRGKLYYTAFVATGSGSGCVGDPFPCHTLTNPFGAEVHSALFVPNGGVGRQAAQFLSGGSGSSST